MDQKQRQPGEVGFMGLSCHDRLHIKWMIETYPDTVQVACAPYNAKTKMLPTDSIFHAIKKHDVGVFGIKPFTNNSPFKPDSPPDRPTAEEDDKLARMAIRYILRNPILGAPIPGLINTDQVNNVVRAVQKRRELDLAEAKELEEAMDEAWVKLPPHYQRLKDWEYV